jgi:hypothetical protein
LAGISIHPVTTQKQAFFLTQLPEKKETTQRFRTMRAMETLKQLRVMAVIGEPEDG